MSGCENVHRSLAFIVYSRAACLFELFLHTTYCMLLNVVFSTREIDNAICNNTIIIISKTMFMVLSSWLIMAEPLQEFTWFI